MLSKKILKKIGLYNEVTFTLNMSQNQVTTKLKEMVNQKVPSKNKKDEPIILHHDGIVTPNFFDINFGSGNVAGDYFADKDHGTKTLVIAKIKGFNFAVAPSVFLLLIVIPIQYVFSFISTLSNPPLFMALYVVGAILLSLLASIYISPAGGIKQLKREFVQIMYFFTKPVDEGIIGDVLVDNNHNLLPIIGENKLNFTMTYRLTKNDFVEGFLKVTKPRKPLFQLHNFFSKHKSYYMGEINEQTFSISGLNLNNGMVDGHFYQDGEKLIIKGTLSDTSSPQLLSSLEREFYYMTHKN